MRLRMAILMAAVLVLALLAGSAVPTDLQAQAGTVSCTLQSATSSTGNGTPCPVGGYNLLTVQVSGTMGGIQFEGTVDGTNYVALLCMDTPSLVYRTSTAVTGVFFCSVKGFAFARARISTAGTNVAVAALASTLTWGSSAF